jgi:hypothetical protein
VINRPRRLATFVALLSGIFSPLAAQSPDLIARGEATTVYITYSFTDPKTGGIVDVFGSGVVVSNHGHVLTAYHVMKEWLRQPATERAKHKLSGSIGSIYAPPGNLILTATQQEQGDFAVLKFGYRPTGGYAAAPICFYGDLSDLADRRFTAFGFPKGKNIQPVPGIFGNSTGEVPGTWSAQSNFIGGMSGGPVFDNRGLVVGIIHGGEGAPVQYVMPSVRMKSGLADNNIEARCESVLPGTGAAAAPSPVAGRAPVSIPPNCNEVIFTDSSVFPVKTTKRILCK